MAPSTAPPSASSRSTRRRSTTCASPAAAPSRSRWSRPTRKEQGLFRTAATPDADLQRHARARPRHGRAEPRRPAPAAGPRAAAPTSRRRSPARCDDAEEGRQPIAAARRPTTGSAPAAAVTGPDPAASTGSVVIAAITSCTNTSNPSVMIGAGLLAKKAVERGLTQQAVGEDQPRARLEGGHRLPADGRPARRTSRRSASTSSATAARPASATAGRCPTPSRRGDRATATWSSPRCSPATATSRAASTRDVRANYLASPPLVVAYALAGTMDIDLATRAARHGHATASRSSSRHLADRAPRSRRSMRGSVTPQMFRDAVRQRLRGRRRAGARCRCRRATASPGTPTRPTSGGRRSSTA